MEHVLDSVEATMETKEANFFLSAITSPYEMTQEASLFQNTDAASDLNYQTFCGT